MEPMIRTIVHLEDEIKHLFIFLVEQEPLFVLVLGVGKTHGENVFLPIPCVGSLLIFFVVHGIKLSTERRHVSRRD
jgi:ABC-type polysaccharide/polyol phosphate export permease